MWELIGTEDDCAKFRNRDTGDIFLMDIGLFTTGKMKDRSKTIDALCKERLPKKGDKKYPVIVSIGRKHFITKYIYETSCDTLEELQSTLIKIFDDQRECPSIHLTWYCECPRETVPPDMGYRSPMMSGIII